MMLAQTPKHQTEDRREGNDTYKYMKFPRYGMKLQSIDNLTEYHGGVDLAVGVCGAVALALLHQVFGGHCNHHRLLLQSVNVLHHSSGHQVLPATCGDRETEGIHPSITLL